MQATRIAFFICWIVGLSLSGGSASADDSATRVAELSSVQPSYNLSSKLDYVAQTQRSYELEDFLADHPVYVQWQQNWDEVLNLGFGKGVHWFRLKVRNTHSESIEQLLEIANPVLDEVVFYQVSAAGEVIQTARTGDHLAMDQRPYFHHNLILPFELPAHAEHTLYFKVLTDGALQLPVVAWETRAFQNRDQMRLLAFGVFFGVLLVMSCYNFFLYTMIKDKGFLYYAAFSACLMLFQGAIHGFSSQFSWFDTTWWRTYSIVLLIPLLAGFAILFTRSFLQLDRAHEQIHKILGAMGHGSFLLAVLALFLPYGFLVTLEACLAVPISIFLLCLGILRWFEGYRSARFFVLAWAVFLCAVVVYALSKLGVIPSGWVSEYSMQVGAMVETVLFAFALADRMNSQRISYIAAQKKAISVQRAAKENLEDVVTERTRTLKETLGQLEDANERLQSLSTLDGLTEIKNRRYFDERLLQEWQRAIRTDGILAMILLDIDHFKQFNDKHGHLAGDECLKQVARILDVGAVRPTDAAARYGGEEFALILPDTDAEGAYHVAEGIRTILEQQSIIIDGHAEKVTASFGVASLKPDHGGTAASLIAAADEALYTAKLKGRNRVQRHQPDMLR